MNMFLSMSQCSDEFRTTVMNSFKPGAKDVDKMEICMSPRFYTRQFNNPLALVRLSSHAPRIKRTKPGDRTHEFSEWLLLAESCYQLWIDPRYKDAFYTELKKTRTINPAKNPWVSSYGSAYIPTTILASCLTKAGCPTIRYKAYGQKLPVHATLMGGFEPTDKAHPQRNTNEWDIGVTYQSPYIILFRPGEGATPGTKHYPMLSPASRDFGSVQTTVVWEDTTLKVKIYPRLVHVIKSFNSRLQGEILTTLAGAKKRFKASVNMVQLLSQVPEEEIGGFRIEVTVPAPTLGAACMWMDRSPFTGIGFWTNPTPGGAGPKVNMMVTRKEALLLSANWMVQRATTLKVFQGTDARPPTMLQKQVTADVLASFGWNAGRYKVTKAGDKAAWWRGKGAEGEQGNPDTPQPDEARTGTHHSQRVTTKVPDTVISQILLQLNRIYPGDAGTRDLVKELRKHHPNRDIPCQKDSNHAYNIYGWGPFRMRCAEWTCKHHLNAGNSYIWFANLIATGQVPGHKLGLPPMEGLSMVAPSPPVNRITPMRAKLIAARQSHVAQKAKLLAFRTALQGPAPPPSHPPYRVITDDQVSLVTGSNPPVYHTSWVAPDGNCMFSAIALSLGETYTAAEVRKEAVRWMGSNSENFIQFIDAGQLGQDEAFKQYLVKMKQAGEWGDVLVLKAICQRYKVRISVLKCREDGSLLWNHLGARDHPRCIWLYLRHHHYENLYPASQVTRVW
jgi:hypothetical protein